MWNQAELVDQQTIDFAAPGSIYIGDGNTIRDGKNYAIIGSRNIIYGEGIFVKGDDNTVHGVCSRLTGKRNLVLNIACRFASVRGSQSITFGGGPQGGIRITYSGDALGEKASDAPESYWSSEETQQTSRSVRRRDRIYDVRSYIYDLRSQLYEQRSICYGRRAQNRGNVSATANINASINIINGRLEKLSEFIAQLNELLSIRADMNDVEFDQHLAAITGNVAQFWNLWKRNPTGFGEDMNNNRPPTTSGGPVRRLRMTISEAPQAPPPPPQDQRYPEPWPDEPEEEKDESKQCKICFTRAIATTCVPCGHAYSCVACVQSKPTQCAVCRQPLTSVIRLFRL